MTGGADEISRELGFTGSQMMLGCLTFDNRKVAATRHRPQTCQLLKPARVQQCAADVLWLALRSMQSRSSKFSPTQRCRRKQACV